MLDLRFTWFKIMILTLIIKHGIGIRILKHDSDFELKNAPLDKMSTLYRVPSIDASYQVSVHLAEGFQRRRLKCEKLTDDRRQTPSDGKSSHCLWQSELIKKLFFISSIKNKFCKYIQKWKICKGPSNDHSCTLWVQWCLLFLRKSFYFPIGY
jgi:hypothetical protein